MKAAKHAAGKAYGQEGVSAGQRSSLATLKGTLQVITCELCRIKGKHECCKSHYTAALCFHIAIKVMPTALNFESHSICFRSQKEVSIYNVPHPYLIKALHEALEEWNTSTYVKILHSK